MIPAHTKERMVELANTMLDAWTTQDVARVLDTYTEDLVYTDPNTTRPISGRAAFARYLERLFSEWTMSWALREAHPIDGGAGAQVLWTGNFRRSAGGPIAKIDGMDLVLLDGDRIQRNDVVFDRTRLPQKDAPADARRMLLEGWMTHDAMWLRAAVDELGVAKANALNLRAVRDTAAIEARRVLALMGIERVTTLETLGAFLRRAREVFVGDLLDAAWTLEPPNVLHLRVADCFAEKGVSRLGILPRYECGIYERMFGWLDALGIRHAYEPATRACTKGANGSCSRTVRLELPGAPAAATLPVGTEF
jgi:ketosteroid isomerase-like protein